MILHIDATNAEEWTGTAIGQHSDYLYCSSVDEDKMVEV